MKRETLPKKTQAVHRTATRGVHHLALNTEDMRATVDFYTRVVGMPLVHAMKVPPGLGTGPGNRGNPPYEQIRHYFFDMGNDSLLAFFEIPRGAEPRAKRDGIGGMQHVAFAITPAQFAALQERLRAASVAFDGPIDILPGLVSIYFFDPNGIRLEACCQPKAGAAAAALALLPRGSFNAASRGVPMGNGWTWFAAAWSIFRAAAGTWIGMLLALIVIGVVANLLPVIGPVVLTVLWPVFIAGLMIASRTIEQGSEPKFTQLFAAFQHRFGPLVLLGVVSLVISLAIVFAVIALTGVQIFAIGAGTSPEAVLTAMFNIAFAGLLMAALMLPLVMATWFAPALIAFHDMGVVAAMKASFVGCMKNVLPFLLYGVIALVASAIASVPFLLGWLVLGPVLFASVYTGYRDIYFEPI